MELKEIIEISRQKIIETHNAFFGDHPEVAEKYLFIHKYFMVIALTLPTAVQTHGDRIREKPRAEDNRKRCFYSRNAYTARTYKREKN